MVAAPALKDDQVPFAILVIIIFVARDGKANCVVTILAVALKSFVLAPLFIVDWAPHLIVQRTLYEALGAVFCFSIGAVCLNYVRRLEQRQITRGEENQKLINKIPNGLLVISQERDKAAGITETLVLSNIKAETIIKRE